MKKLGAMVTTCALILSLCAAGCSQQSTVDQENPLTTVESADDIAIQTDLEMTVPRGATDIAYYVVEDYGTENALGQVDFTLGGIRYSYRQQKTDKATDISGKYYGWQNTAEATYDTKKYTISYNTGAEGISLYYDEETGISHSISVDTDASEEVLRSISQTTFLN